MAETSHRSFDVTVVGAGISGLSAAVAAAAAGARVAVLERATEDEFGGNTRWTEAYFRMLSEDEVSADLEERLAEMPATTRIRISSSRWFSPII